MGPCVGICTNGAPSIMVGFIKGFITFGKNKNPNIISTHCFYTENHLFPKHYQ